MLNYGSARSRLTVQLIARFKSLTLVVKPLMLLGLLFSTTGALSQTWTQELTADGSTVTPRHEAGYIAHDNKLYLFGGRDLRPVSVFDSATGLWSTVPSAPIELHHFQPVVVNNKIYVLGSFTCCYPNEVIVEDIYTFYPATSAWEVVGTMPTDRARGSTAAVVRNNKIYLLGGNTQGHSGGVVAWFDEYDPSTNSWRQLPDAPTPRDHFSAALVGNKLVASAGRQTNGSFANLVSATEVYDFSSGQWTTSDPIPTPRAGALVAEHNNNIYVMGGESDVTHLALKTVEAYDVLTGKWRTFTNMLDGRHSGGAGMLGNRLHAASGNLSRGGSYETDLHESVDMSDSDGDGLLDTEEVNIHSTDPTKTDSDGDGISDWQEVNNSDAINSTLDSDGDGITDQQEILLYGTNPTLSDTDGDGLNDKSELNQHLTDPLIADSDSDGADDGTEIAAQLDPNNPDTDGDKLNDGPELNTHNTDPTIADTDSDGLIDGDEITAGTDPRLADSDQDGLTDGEEVNSHSTNPLVADTDGDTLSDIDELQVHMTNPALADSDSDGLEDSAELQIHSSDPNNPDTDGDSIDDGTEIANGTSLTNVDEDQDGILNSAEGNADADGDGLANFMDMDSDNDGISDTVENTPPTDETAQSPATGANLPPTAQLIDTDRDGVPDFLDLDSDQDGITDKAEVGLNDETTTGRIQPAELIDENNDGWLDTFATTYYPLRDTDGDLIPDYLDHDSDDDGKSDLIETGGIDIDDDGVIDEIMDSNADGLHDTLLGAARVEVDEDDDRIPDHLDSVYSRSAFGCSLLVNSTNEGPVDPLLPTVLIMLLALCYRRQRVVIGKQR